MIKTIINYFLDSSQEEELKNFIHINPQIAAQLKENDLGATCTICKGRTKFLSQIGQSVYNVCKGDCEKMLLDALTYEIIYKQALYKNVYWSPTIDYDHCKILLDYIKDMGYLVALWQEKDSWRIVIAKRWHKDERSHSLVEDDPLMAISKMTVTLHDLINHPESCPEV